MKLICEYIDTFKLDGPAGVSYDVWYEYPFGTKRVSCGWCTNRNCSMYDNCNGHISYRDFEICWTWRCDYI